MRTKNSIINVMITGIIFLFTALISFISKRYFIFILGEEYLGINSLFTSIISFLSIAELGIGAAIIYNLYKPFYDNDIETLKSIIKFYKIVYVYIASVVLVLGLILMPFIKRIVGEVNINSNIYIIFLLFVIDSCISYLFSYKRSILFVCQKNYIVTFIHFVIFIFLNIVQIVLLFKFRNYLLYLFIQIIFHFIENIIISCVAEFQFPFIKEKNVRKIDNNIKNDIIHKVKGLLLHQVGSIVVNGTDNLIISLTKSLGIIIVGYYSNYYMIMNYVATFLNQVFNSIVASIGNLLIDKDTEYSYIIYKRILFINFILCAIFSSVSICVLEDLIRLWLGEKFVFNKLLLFVIVINFFVQEMKLACGIFQTAAGLFYENRYVPFIEAIFNLLFSILFVKKFGLPGVIMGTIISSLIAHWFFSFPMYVYKLVFSKDVLDYFIDYIKYCIVFVVAIIVSYNFSNIVNFDNSLIKIISKSFLSLIICTFICFILFYKCDEFKYWTNFVFSTLKNKLKEKK